MTPTPAALTPSEHETRLSQAAFATAAHASTILFSDGGVSAAGASAGGGASAEGASCICEPPAPPSGDPAGVTLPQPTAAHSAATSPSAAREETPILTTAFCSRTGTTNGIVNRFAARAKPRARALREQLRHLARGEQPRAHAERCRRGRGRRRGP